MLLVCLSSHNVPHSFVPGVGVNGVLGQQVGQQLEGVLVILVLLDARRDHRVAQRLEHPRVIERLSLLQSVRIRKIPTECGASRVTKRSQKQGEGERRCCCKKVQQVMVSSRCATNISCRLSFSQPPPARELSLARYSTALCLLCLSLSLSPLNRILCTVCARVSVNRERLGLGRVNFKKPAR